MIQGIRRLASVDTEHNLLHETLARNSLGLIPVIATDSSTITRDTLPANYAQYYNNGSTNRLYININNSIVSINLADIDANTALSNLSSTEINTSLLPNVSNTHSLGSSSKQWKDIYVGGLGGDLDFNDHQAKNLIIENRSDDNGMTVTGQIWFRVNI